MPKDSYPNDVGVGWKKQNDKGTYVSIVLHIDKILDLAGGDVGEIDLLMYPIKSDNPKAPDYSFKFYPKGGGARSGVQKVGERTRMPEPRAARRQSEPPPPLEDEDDFPPF